MKSKLLSVVSGELTDSFSFQLNPVEPDQTRPAISHYPKIRNRSAISSSQQTAQWAEAIQQRISEIEKEEEEKIKIEEFKKRLNERIIEIAKKFGKKTIIEKQNGQKGDKGEEDEEKLPKKTFARSTPKSMPTQENVLDTGTTPPPPPPTPPPPPPPPPPPIRQYKPALAWDPGGGWSTRQSGLCLFNFLLLFPFFFYVFLSFSFSFSFSFLLFLFLCFDAKRARLGTLEALALNVQD